MSDERSKSLRSQFPGHLEIPVLLVLAAILLPLGLLIPTLTLSKLAGITGSTYSIITGIVNLAQGENPLLALLIFTFSLVFPILKLTMLFVLWFLDMKPERRSQALRVLRVLGKWSMLDVFVIVALVGAIQFGVLAEATPRVGIYLFSTAVLTCILVTLLESRLAQGSEEGSKAGKPQNLTALSVALLALLLLGAGLFLPLLETKKWVFWSQDFSVLGAVGDMFRKGYYGLTAMVLFFVILVPLGKILGQVVVLVFRRKGSAAESLAGKLDFLDPWMMIDVFFLGVVVVAVQLGGIADVSPLPGLACFLAAVFLSASLPWIVNR